MNAEGGPFAGQQPRHSLNPYIRFLLDQGQLLGRSKVLNDTMEPEWNETCFLLLNNLNAQLSLELNTQCLDDGQDERVATAYFDLRELDDDDRHIQEGM